MSDTDFQIELDMRAENGSKPADNTSNGETL
jgi:hypothetical protein